MDEEETPCKKITRRIQANPQFLYAFLSFSLGLTQNFEEILGSMAKSRISQQDGDKNIYVKKSGQIPRILNWVTEKDYPRIDYFIKAMFRDVNNSAICLIIPKKIPHKVVQDHDIQRPQTRNVPVSPSVKTRRVRYRKQPDVVVT
uniref:Uncharacterized protein n=1 Tax=Solanum lycopersicum TaxID=4081 RepID=K4AUD7_SOLLC